MKNIISVFLGLTFTLFYTVGEGATVKDININEQLKRNILLSSLKAPLRTKDGRELMAYLYAENERHEKEEYFSCITGKPIKTELKIGDYYIYLYDIESGSFLPTRIKIFPEFKRHTFNTEGAELIVLSGLKKNKSDVLLISQFGACNGNFFDAYGFSSDDKKLKRYFFLTDEKQYGFYGRIGSGKVNYELTAYGVSESKLSMFLSSIPGVIQVNPN